MHYDNGVYTLSVLGGDNETAIVEGDIITMVPGNITTVDVYATMHAFENDFSHTTMESIYD